MPAYGVFALIRNFPFDQITLYAFLEYGLTASLSFTAIFEIQLYKSKWLNKILRWETKTLQRVFVELTSSLLITTFVVITAYATLYMIVWKSSLFLPSIYMYVIMVYFISLCFMAFVNAVPLIHEWKKTIIKSESLEKETAKARLEALRTQLSPHFFFNNLSILNGLIEQNTAEAKAFTSKLSDVFRYILAHKNDEIVPLKDEINFIEDYVFLLKTRYKEKFNVAISLQNPNFWIPPVTLQQLVENTIKHNEASFKKPLTVKITQSNDWLIVENPIQPKLTSTHSTQIGLANIAQRFEMLTDKKVIREKLNDTFTIKLPLLIYDENNNRRG
jgi:LytS/YehU family sensor histidine kinase